MANNKYIYSFVMQRKIKKTGSWKTVSKGKYKTKEAAEEAKRKELRTAKKWGLRAWEVRVVKQRRPNPKYVTLTERWHYGTAKERAEVERILRRAKERSRVAWRKLK